MATLPDEDEVQQTTVERIRGVVASPIGERQRPVTLLAISAGLASLAPVPFGALAVIALVIVAAERGRR